MSEQGYRVLLGKASKIRNWSDYHPYRERFRKVISKPDLPERLSSALPETHSDAAEVQVAILTNFLFPPEKPANFSECDRLQVAYGLLTILHDKIYEYDPLVAPISIGIWSPNAEWIEALWQKIKKGSEAVAGGDSEFFDKIDYALDLVEADLAEKEEAEGESRHSKIGFLQELTPEEPSD